MVNEHPEDRVIERESERYLFASFQVGESVAEFLRSDAGRYLQGMAEQEIGEAVRTFLNHDTHRSLDQVAQAHVKAQRARQSFIWMLEAIEQGENAEYQLRELDDLERP